MYLLGSVCVLYSNRLQCDFKQRLLNKITSPPECEFKAVHSCYCLLFYFTLCLKEEALTRLFVSNQQTTAQSCVCVMFYLPLPAFVFFSALNLCLINQFVYFLYFYTRICCLLLLFLPPARLVLHQNGYERAVRHIFTSNAVI